MIDLIQTLLYPPHVMVDQLQKRIWVEYHSRWDESNLKRGTSNSRHYWIIIHV